MRLEEIRREYGIGRLRREDLDTDPLRGFERWLEQAWIRRRLAP